MDPAEGMVLLRGARAATFLLYFMAFFFLVVGLAGIKEPFVAVAGLSASALAVAFSRWLRSKTPSKLVFGDAGLEITRGSEVVTIPWNEIEVTFTPQMISCRFLHARGFLLLVTNEGRDVFRRVEEQMRDRPLRARLGATT